MQINRSTARASKTLPSLLLLLLVATTAAAVSHFASPPPGGRAPSQEYGNPAIRTGPLAYPRQATDSDSFVVRVAKPAHRIVSQYWSIDEYIYSVVPPERVLAVSQTAYLDGYSNVYAQVQRYRPVIATDPERVLRLNPDLIMVSDSSRADFCALVRAADIPIYRTFTGFTTLQQVAETIRLTGYMTGEEQSATSEINRFWTAIQRAKARRPAHAPRPRILGVGGTYSYGKESLFDDIVRELGGINVAAQGGVRGYDQVNSEQIAVWNPEWIVASAAKGSTQQVLKRMLADPGIALTQAAKNGHILVFEQNVFLPMSPYLTTFVSKLSEALYG